jgi:hypothetical protein
MRYLDIFIFIFIFNVSISMVDQFLAPMFGISSCVFDIGGQASKDYALSQQTNINSGVNTAYNNTLGSANVLGNFFNGVYNIVFSVIIPMLNMLLGATVLFTSQLNCIISNMLGGADVSVIVGPIGIIMTFISIFALYQLATGRSFKEGQ